MFAACVPQRGRGARLLPAALLGELRWPSSAADPDTHPSGKMGSLSKYL